MRHLEINDPVTFQRTEAGQTRVPGAVDVYPAGPGETYVFVIRERCTVIWRDENGNLILEAPYGRRFEVHESDPRLKPDGWIALFVSRSRVAESAFDDRF